MLSYLILVATVLGSLAIGFILNNLGAPKQASKYLFLFVLFACQSPLSLLAVWSAKLTNRSQYMPLLVISGWFLSLLLARILSPKVSDDSAEKGAFILTVGMSNHGFTLLGFVALMFFGDQGVSQATYAQFLVVPYLICVCFPIGRFYGEGQGTMAGRELLWKSVTDPKSLPLLAMVVGLSLNLTGVPRPEWGGGAVVMVVLYAGVIASGLAVGLLHNSVTVVKYLQPSLVNFSYRMTLYPAWYYLLAKLTGLNREDTTILVLFGLVPPGIYANMIATLFKLKTELTQSVFVVCTVLFLIIPLPLLIYFLL